MGAFGVGGAQVPVHVEHGDVSNKRRRSRWDVAYVEFVVFEGVRFDRAHVAHRPFRLRLVTDAAHVFPSIVTLGYELEVRSAKCF